MHKNWRQFMREYGKTAHREKTTKSSKVYTVDGLHIGDVVAYWDSMQTMYKYRGIITHRGEVHSKEYYDFEQAERYVHHLYYTFTQYSKFGDWLNNKLIKIDMTMMQTGLFLGTPQKTIEKWIGGQELPDIQRFVNLARMICAKSGQSFEDVLTEMSYQIQ